MPLADPRACAAWFGCVPKRGDAARIAFGRADAERPFLTASSAMWSAFEPSLRQRLSEAMDAHFARHNLSKGRFQILMHLKRKEGPLSPAELAENCGVTRATVTGLVDTLEHAGLVERVQDSADRRSVQVRLTPAGDAHLDQMLPDHYRRLEGVMAGLTKDELKVFVELLGKIETGIPAVREP